MFGDSVGDNPCRHHRRCLDNKQMYGKQMNYWVLCETTGSNIAIPSSVLGKFVTKLGSIVIIGAMAKINKLQIKQSHMGYNPAKCHRRCLYSHRSVTDKGINRFV